MKNKTPDFAYHMTKFFTEYLPIQRNLSPNSIATYRDTFRLLLLFYDTEKHIKPNLLTLDMLNVQQIHRFYAMAQKGKKLWGKYLQSTIRRIKIIFQVSAIRTTRLCPAMSGKFSHTANEATRTWVKISYY